MAVVWDCYIALFLLFYLSPPEVIDSMDASELCLHAIGLYLMHTLVFVTPTQHR